MIRAEGEAPPPLSLTHGLWSHYTVFDGLAGMRVEDVYQDSQGFVWIATADGGVSRFDGAHFDNLSVAQGLPHPTVTSIAEWEGLLWFGTFGGGLAAWDGRRFAVYTTAQGLPADDILKLRVMADGRLAVMTTRGVGWFARGRCQERLETLGGQPVGPVYDLLMDHSGEQWLATLEHGVISTAGRRLQANTPDGRDILHHAWNLTQDLRGDLWIASNYVEATAYALCCRAGQAQPEVLAIDGASAQSPLKYGVRHVRADARGWVWHAFRGVFVFDGATWQQLSIPLQGREFADVRLSYEDREGNIWLGYWGGGLAFCDPSSLRRFSESEGLPHREVTALAADRGRVWIGTPGGLAVMEAGRVVPGLPEVEGQRLIHCLHLDHRGHLWAGADAGRIYCLEGEELQVVQGADDRVENAALCADGQGRLWVGQHPPGEVGWLEEDRFRPLREALDGAAGLERGLIGVDAIAQDPQGRIWFGARGDERALSCFDGRQLRVFGVADGFVKTHYVHALAFGPDGALWIGTGVGLVAYQAQRFRHYTVADGLPENAINALAFDRQGRLWIGTSGGGAVCWDGQVFQVIRLGNSPGENTVNAILIDHQDQVWFGTRAGLAAYYPGTLPPRVVIRQVLAEALHREPESLTCPASVSEIRIGFQGLGFKSGARQMCYSWRLRGHQNRWSRFRAESEVVYAGLAPGEYTFEVRAMDRNGLCSAPARLPLIITPDLQADRIQALAGALSQGAGAEQFIGQGPAIRRALEQMQALAGSQVRVLIAGETGTGKGLAARAIHALSRRIGPFIQVNCGAIPAGLVESELFGHERGAFTGATARKLGCFEVAQGGTLFLDEIGDLPLESQAVLLEVLQEGSFRRVGGRGAIRAEARVIAATNRDLEGAVAQGLFRLDLFYRLNGFTLQLPPLRQRREDIALLVQHFVRRFAQHLNRTPPTLRPEVLALLQRYAWPGNVRELEHLAQRAVLLCKGGFIEVDDLPLSVIQGEEAGETGFVPLEEYERAYIEKALEAAGGVIYGERGAARLLGVAPEKLRSRMRVLGIKRRG